MAQLKYFLLCIAKLNQINFFLFCFTSKQHERTEENLQQTYKNMEIFVAANNKVGISKGLFEQMSVKLTFIDK